jgi:hypothetical protein
MSHTTVFAQGHETRRVEHGESKKAIAHVLPGEGTKSLWVLGEFLTHKIPSQQTGGAYVLFEAATPPGAGPPPTSTTARTRPSTCSKDSMSS